MPTTFQQFYVVVMGVLREIPDSKHVSKTKLSQAAIDIAVVAMGIRSGYLFDAFSVRNPTRDLKELLTEVLTKLRQKLEVFEAVVLVHDPACDQLFVVNVARLATCYNSGGQPLHRMTFVELHSTCIKLSTPPAGVLALLEHVLAIQKDGTPPLILPLPEHGEHCLGDIVAFAACILEFPMAYVPIGDGSGPFLAGVPLDVYECILVHPLPDHIEHNMLKFSCPQTLAAQKSELRPDVLRQRLQAQFANQLEQVGLGGNLIIRHTVETMDRVAL